MGISTFKLGSVATISLFAWFLIIVLGLIVSGLWSEIAAILYRWETNANPSDFVFIPDIRLLRVIIYMIIMLPVTGALFLAVLKTEDEQKKLIRISMLYIAIFLLVMGVLVISTWGYDYYVIAYVPFPLLEWSFIGGIAAVLYRLAFQQNNPDTRFYIYIITKPILGLIMGGLVFFIALGSSILLGNTAYSQLIEASNVTQTVKNQLFYSLPGTGIFLPRYMIYWLNAIAFIGGFSDYFSTTLMDRFLSGALGKQEESTKKEQERISEDK